MIFYYANGSIFDIKKLNNRYCYSKKRSCDHKISNFTFFSIRNGCMAGGMGLVLTNTVVVMLVLLLVSLTMPNIVLQRY